MDSPVWVGLVQSGISAAAGLGGAVLGYWLSSGRAAAVESDRRARESAYLAVLVSAHLDAFAWACLDVAFDEGETDASNGFQIAGTTLPAFKPLDFEVDWKVLPTDVMQAVLGLPARIDLLGARIYDTQMLDDPPDFAETFQARQYGYAELGIEAVLLAARLRRHAKLPDPVPIPIRPDSPPGDERRLVDLLEGRVALLRARHARWMTAYPGLPSLTPLSS